MRPGLVVTGVLGLGTAVVFAFAALTASLFPSGTLVGGGMNGMMMDQRFGGGVAVPPKVLIETTDGVRTVPVDILVSEPTP